MQAADAVDVHALPPHQRPQLRHAGGVVDHFVKQQVGVVEALEVSSFRVLALFGYDAAQVAHGAGVGRCGEGAHGFKFYGAAQKLRLARRGHVNQADDRAALWKR